MLEFVFSDFRPVIQNVLAYSICAAALIWGAGPERAIAITWLVLFELLGGAYSMLWDSAYQLEQVDVFLAMLDGLAGIIWIGIAFNANRNYPLVIAAMQLVAMTGHLTRSLIEAISPVAYATMVIAPSWLQLLVLAFGLARHIRRKRTFGPYRDWRVPVRLGGLLPQNRKRV